jgi:hypothetical protein
VAVKLFQLPRSDQMQQPFADFYDRVMTNSSLTISHKVRLGHRGIHHRHCFGMIHEPSTAEFSRLRPALTFFVNIHIRTLSESICSTAMKLIAISAFAFAIIRLSSGRFYVGDKTFNRKQTLFDDEPRHAACGSAPSDGRPVKSSYKRRWSGPSLQVQRRQPPPD